MPPRFAGPSALVEQKECLMLWFFVFSDRCPEQGQDGFIDSSSLILHLPSRKCAKGNCVAIAATVIPMPANPGV